jgi:hypothetical protein
MLTQFAHGLASDPLQPSGSVAYYWKVKSVRSLPS